MVRLISRQRGGLAALKLTKLFGIDDFPAAKDAGKVLIIIIYCYLIIIIDFTAFFKICFCFVLLYNKSLNDWSLGYSEFCFPRISMFPSTSSRETLEILGQQN